MNHRRMHAMHRRQLVDRPVASDRCQRHLRLERCAMGLPFPRHDYPFLGQPTVAYSTVQFLRSTSLCLSPQETADSFTRTINGCVGLRNVNLELLACGPKCYLWRESRLGSLIEN